MFPLLLASSARCPSHYVLFMTLPSCSLSVSYIRLSLLSTIACLLGLSSSVADPGCLDLLSIVIHSFFSRCG